MTLQKVEEKGGMVVVVEVEVVEVEMVMVKVVIAVLAMMTSTATPVKRTVKVSHLLRQSKHHQSVEK